MRLFQFWRHSHACSVLLGLVLLVLASVPALAQENWRTVRTPAELPWIASALLAEARTGKGTEPAVSALSALAALPAPEGAYERAEYARVLAQGAAQLSTNPSATGWARAAETLLEIFPPWLSRYEQFEQAADMKEPAWVNSQPEAVAQAILAWVALEQIQPSPGRRELVNKFALGLDQCLHKAPNQYPFRAHTSFSPKRADFPAYAPIPTGGQAPGAMWIPHRCRQVEALIAAAKLVAPGLLESATQEALGIWASLATSGRMPFAFSPRPEGEGTALADSVLVDNFMSLYAATENPLYAALAGVGSLHSKGRAAKTAAEEAALVSMKLRLENSPATLYANAKDVNPPTTYWVMEAEDGKAVKKAFEAFDVTYPGGTPGKMVRVGGGDMFWMRFDVEREGDYDFYLVFLKSPLEGGLVSIMMRIDGDKIFQIPLGGASDSYVDLEFVEGPRFLRQGPHSFGIRFSGLLMTQPGIVDSVIAWPVVERRHLQLPDGRQLLLLHSHSAEAARTSYAEITNWPPSWIQAVDGFGKQANVERQTDKRRRKEYLLVPPAGTALLEWKP